MLDTSGSSFSVFLSISGELLSYKGDGPKKSCRPAIKIFFNDAGRPDRVILSSKKAFPSIYISSHLIVRIRLPRESTEMHFLCSKLNREQKSSWRQLWKLTNVLWYCQVWWAEGFVLQAFYSASHKLETSFLGMLFLFTCKDAASIYPTFPAKEVWCLDSLEVLAKLVLRRVSYSRRSCDSFNCDCWYTEVQGLQSRTDFDSFTPPYNSVVLPDS